MKFNRILFVFACIVIASEALANEELTEGLHPAGKSHIPIGIPNSLDSLKTFVEAEGGFSPGIGSYGIAYWVYVHEEQKLYAPTMSGVAVDYGLKDSNSLIPWAKWKAGPIEVHTEVCEIKRSTPDGDVYLVGSRVKFWNAGPTAKRISLYLTLSPLGPAGFSIHKLAVSDGADALLVEGHTAVVANKPVTAAGVYEGVSVSDFALRGLMPKAQEVSSTSGNCSGALKIDLTIKSGYRTAWHGFVFPVHAGRRAVRHKWEPLDINFVDVAVPKSDADGINQPDLGLDAYREIDANELFSESSAYWQAFFGEFTVQIPENDWSWAFNAMLAHAGLILNEGAPDVSVLNYTVFNRDGMYIANIMQKAGLPELSEAIIDFFIQSPFNGRPFPESDNPGQVLWSMGQHWLLTRDKAWLQRIYPAAEKLVQMIEYYRTGTPPFWVNLNSLNFGDALPEDQRKELHPGRCDGYHPEYTEAFDITGIRTVAEFAEVLKKTDDAEHFRELAGILFAQYDARFGEHLGSGYGKYAVLWPSRLYPLDQGAAHDQFEGIGPQNLSHWRYFAPATAHQGLLAGNRKAGYETVNLHLRHAAFHKTWYACDEGGKSGSGGWYHLRTTWPHNKTEPDRNYAVAMPHGWAIAEVWLLMRDCLVFEDRDRLVLFGGISPATLQNKKGIKVHNLPTYFGPLDVQWRPGPGVATLTLGDRVKPPRGFALRLPDPDTTIVMTGGKTIPREPNGDFLLPPGTAKVAIEYTR